ncbi:rab11 family-interacting protein 3 isoform X3 [Pogona vitticeps]
MTMDPDLLLTLSDPGSKGDRDPLRSLEQHLLGGRYILLEPPPPLALPSPDLVLLGRESPPGNNGSSNRSPGAPLALEQVLIRGMKGAQIQPWCPDGSVESLYRMEEEEEEEEEEGNTGLEDRDLDQGPISDGQTDSGVDDLGEAGLDLRLVPLQEESAQAWREEGGSQEPPVSGFLSLAESPHPPDLHLVVGEDAEEVRQGRGPYPSTQEDSLQPQSDDHRGLEAVAAGEEPLSGLLLSPTWTREVEGCRPPSPVLRPLDLALDPQVGPGGDGFPCPLASDPLEFGPSEQMLGEDEAPPGSPENGPRLRAVFDALDRDGDGFVRIEEFVQFATVYGAEQVKDLTKFLDPAGLGVISFEDFYRGISAIRNGADPEHQLCAMTYAHEEPPSACPDEFDDFVAFEANEVTDSAYMGSESTYSECETFTDEDTSTLVHQEMHDDVETDSAIDSTVHSEVTDPMEEPEHGSHPHDLPLASDVNGHSIVTVISGEEHFEDYGEGNEGDLFSDSLYNGESGFSSSSFLSPRHLHQTSALTMDAMEEPYRNSTQCLEEDITDKVIFLEKRVIELEKDTAANGEQHSRLKQENLQLVHRANALEEQLKEQELKSDEILMDEIRRQRELLGKIEREKSIEIENLQARLQQVDDENGELRSCVPCLKANIERLEEEKRKLQDEIEDLTVQLNEELENKRKLRDKLNQERHQFQKDKESTQELIEDLRKQLEHLQLFKLEAEQRRGRSSSVGLQEYNSRTRETELEQEIRRLKQDNRNLKEQNDELNGQIINLSIQGAKNLFSTSFSESLAAEISSVSRDELMEAIQKQEEINYRLQDYIDRIIVAIMETNPSILEVK